MDIESAVTEIVTICDQQRDRLVEKVRLLFSQIQVAPVPTDESAQIQTSLAKIKAKDFASASEAGLLLGCSAQHLRNQIQRAIDGKSEVPIPFRDLGGPVVFPVAELLQWAQLPKRRGKAASRKNKTRLKVLAS